MSTLTPNPSIADELWSKLKPHRFIALFVGALTVFFLIALVVILIVKPGAATPPCNPDPTTHCGTPPTIPQTPDSLTAADPPVFGGKLYSNSQLRFGLEYDPKTWNIVSSTASGVQMNWHISGRPDLDLVLIVQGVPASTAMPAQLLQAQISSLKGNILGLKADSSPSHALLSPDIGYVDQSATGGAYAGTLDTPQGPGPRIALLSMAATDGTITLVATALTTSSEEIRLPLMGVADTVLNTLTWPSGAQAQTISSRSSAARPGARNPRLAAANPGSHYLRRTDRATTVDLSLVLRFRQAALDRYLQQLQDPRSPNYQRYLPSGKIGERFGISRAVLARVKQRLAAAGMGGIVTYPQRTSLRFRGTAAAAEALFDTSLGDFQDATGRVYHRPLRPPTIPSDIHGSVVGVTGLSNETLAVPADIPNGVITPRVSAAAYDIAPLHKFGLFGQGQTVAIISFASFHDSDVRKFDRDLGISGPAVKHRRVAGGSPVGAGADEVNLDIDTIRSIAPKAQIIDYEGPNGGVSYADMINAIIADGKADIASMSWTNCDDALNLNPADRVATLQALRAAVARGITLFNSTGDAGSYDCQRHFPTVHRLTVGFPVDSPYVVAVGGTRLATNARGAYAREYGWEDPLSNGGGGGGLNPKDRRPPWQKGPGVTNKYSNGKRQIPDVAAAADPDSGFYVVFDGQGHGIGGTSAATPFWAGSTVLIRQLARRNHVGVGGNKTGKLGFLAPTLYKLASSPQPFPPFHDVRAGGNRYYAAGPGWDFSTGLGSPDVWNLGRDIVRFLRTR